MSLKVIYSLAISVNLNDLGLKLDKRYEKLIGLIISVVPFHEPFNKLLKRFEYDVASSWHFERVYLMNGPQVLTAFLGIRLLK